MIQEMIYRESVWINLTFENVNNSQWNSWLSAKTCEMTQDFYPKSELYKLVILIFMISDVGKDEAEEAVGKE